MDVTTQIKTLEGVMDLLRIELKARSLDEIKYQMNGENVRPQEDPLNLLYTRLGDQIVSLKIRERAK